MATYTESTPALWRFQCDPAADGTCTVQAFYRSELVNNEDETDKLVKESGNVSFVLAPELAAELIALANAARNGA